MAFYKAEIVDITTLISAIKKTKLFTVSNYVVNRHFYKCKIKKLRVRRKQ